MLGKHHLHRVITLFLISLVVSIATAQELTDFLPRNTQLFFRIQNTSQLWEQIKDSPLDSQFAQTLNNAGLSTTPEKFMNNLVSTACVGVMPEATSSDPVFLYLFTVKDVPGIEVLTVGWQLENFKGYTFASPRTGYTFCLVKNILLITNRVEFLKNTLDRQQTSSKNTLTQSPEFTRAMTSIASYMGDADLYLNIPPFFSAGFSIRITPEQIHIISSFPVTSEDTFVTTLAANHPPSQTITIARYIPESSLFGVMINNFGTHYYDTILDLMVKGMGNLPAVQAQGDPRQQIEQFITMFEMQLGFRIRDDFLAGMGPEAALVVTEFTTTPEPNGGYCFICRCKERTALESVMTKLENVQINTITMMVQMQEQQINVPSGFSSVVYKDVNIRYLETPLTGYNIAYVFDGEYLLQGNSKETIMTCIDTHRAGTGNIMDTPEWRETQSLFPEGVNGGLSINTKQLGEVFLASLGGLDGMGDFPGVSLEGLGQIKSATDLFESSEKAVFMASLSPQEARTGGIVFLASSAFSEEEAIVSPESGYTRYTPEQATEKIEKNAIEASFKRIYTYYAQGDYDLVIQECKAIEAADPGNSIALYYRMRAGTKLSEIRTRQETAPVSTPVPTDEESMTPERFEEALPEKDASTPIVSEVPEEPQDKAGMGKTLMVIVYALGGIAIIGTLIFVITFVFVKSRKGDIEAITKGAPLEQGTLNLETPGTSPQSPVYVPQPEVTEPEPSVSAGGGIQKESPVTSPMWEKSEEEKEDEKTGRPTITEEERKAKLDDLFKEEVLEDRSGTWTKAREGGVIVPSETEESASPDEHTHSEEIERVAIPSEQPSSEPSAEPLEEPESVGDQEKSPDEKTLIPLENILEESPKEEEEEIKIEDEIGDVPDLISLDTLEEADEQKKDSFEDELSLFDSNDLIEEKAEEKSGPSTESKFEQALFEYPLQPQPDTEGEPKSEEEPPEDGVTQTALATSTEEGASSESPGIVEGVDEETPSVRKQEFSPSDIEPPESTPITPDDDESGVLDIYGKETLILPQDGEKETKNESPVEELIPISEEDIIAEELKEKTVTGASSNGDTTRVGQTNVDQEKPSERTIMLFDLQKKKGKDAMDSKDYKKALHYLTVADSIIPHNPEIAHLLTEIRKLL